MIGLQLKAQYDLALPVELPEFGALRECSEQPSKASATPIVTTLLWACRILFSHTRTHTHARTVVIAAAMGQRTILCTENVHGEMPRAKRFPECVDKQYCRTHV